MKAHEVGAVWEGKRGVSVDVRDNNIDSAIKALKKKVMQEGIIRDLRRHEYYEKPGDRKRREAAKAKKRDVPKTPQKKKDNRNNNNENNPNRGSINGHYNGAVNLV